MSYARSNAQRVVLLEIEHPLGKKKKLKTKVSKLRSIRAGHKLIVGRLSFNAFASWTELVLYVPQGFSIQLWTGHDVCKVEDMSMRVKHRSAINDSKQQRVHTIPTNQEKSRGLMAASCPSRQQHLENMVRLQEQNNMIMRKASTG